MAIVDLLKEFFSTQVEKIKEIIENTKKDLSDTISISVEKIKDYIEFKKSLNNSNLNDKSNNLND